MAPAVINVLEVIDVDQQKRGATVVAAAVFIFRAQQNFPVATIKHPRHTIKSTHQLKPALMFHQTTRRMETHPGKQHRVKDDHRQREPEFQRRADVVRRHARELQGDQRRQCGHHHPGAVQPDPAHANKVHAYHHDQRRAGHGINPHHPNPDPGHNGVHSEVKHLATMRIGRARSYLPGQMGPDERPAHQQ